jgi:diguanylate cyclase (GGDEF)-like protein
MSNKKTENSPEINETQSNSAEKGDFFEETLNQKLDYTQENMVVALDNWLDRINFSHFWLPLLSCLVVMIFLIYLAYELFINNKTLYGQVHLIFAILSVGCYLFVRKTGKGAVTNNIIVVMFGGLCIFLFYTGGFDGTGPIWYFVFPLAAFFLQKLWAGLLSVIVLFICSLLLYILPVAGFDPTIYPPVFIERFLVVYLTVAILTFFYAFSRASAALKMDYLNKSYQNMANTDPLTKLANRRLIKNILLQEMGRVNRYKKVFSIMIFDLDKFKAVNDNYGHRAGDAVLCSVSEIIKDILRTPDTCARWGGEEFLVLLPDTDLSGAAIVAERLRIGFENFRTSFEGLELSITISIGVAEFNPGDDIEECFKLADSNLYRAKNAGRNCVKSSKS